MRSAVKWRGSSELLSDCGDKREAAHKPTRDQLRAGRENFAIYLLRGMILNVELARPFVTRSTYLSLKAHLVSAISDIKQGQRDRGAVVVEFRMPRRSK
jgi:hypothetical protein